MRLIIIPEDTMISIDGEPMKDVTYLGFLNLLVI
jgi:hypothetical protein